MDKVILTHAGLPHLAYFEKIKAPVQSGGLNQKNINTFSKKTVYLGA